MDIRTYSVDILLTVVMAISTLVLILRFWQVLLIAVAAYLMLLSLGGLFISMQIKVRNHENSVITCEWMLRINLKEHSYRMVENTTERSRISMNSMPNMLNVHTNNVCTRR
ncbi:MAG: hypothetical protein Q7V05_12555 [Methanoregula sp.]|nr:hypothetical protein [Methanoregula sp.]